MGTLSTPEPYLLAWGMVNDFEPVGPSGNIATGNLLATHVKYETYLPKEIFMV